MRVSILNRHLLEAFEDAQGQISFVRVFSGIIIVWSLILLTIHCAHNNWRLPTLSEADTIIALISGALAGKIVQKPFERRKQNEKLDDPEG